MMLKVQSVKEELLTTREDFAREQDGVKMSIEKKCDWESLRKGLGYFEEKMRELSSVVGGLAEGL